MTRTIFLSLIFVLVLSVSGCKGNTVDRSAPSFVDKESVPSPDYVALNNVTEPDVVNATEPSFIAPEVNYTQNATISIDEKKVFIGRDVVKLWVWNSKGSQSLLIAEGGTIIVKKLGITVRVGPIGHENDGKTIVYIDGKASKVLEHRQETRVGDTWIFISDFFLNANQ